DALKEEFQKSNRTKANNILHLIRDFVILGMKELESIKDFVSRFMEVVNQLKIYGEIFKDKEVVEKILISLLKNFDSKIASIEESRGLSMLIVTELIGSFQAHEQ
ncbi:UBN2 domain-containing protein, partial [Cephalotus follicularis]